MAYSIWLEKVDCVDYDQTVKNVEQSSPFKSEPGMSKTFFCKVQVK